MHDAASTTPPAEVGASLPDGVDTPALLLDLDAFEHNLDALARDAGGRCAVGVRPHAKSHKCPEIALRQVARGAVGVCCQKVSEAEAFVRGGIQDVVVVNEIVGGAEARPARPARGRGEDGRGGGRCRERGRRRAGGAARRA